MLRKFASDLNIKKFYKRALVNEIADGYQVLLDRRVLKTPAGSPIILPSRLLALALATEWESQKEFIKQFTMPLMHLISNSIDLEKSSIKHLLIDRILNFLITDSLCYYEDDDLLHISEVLKHFSYKFGFELPRCLGIEVPSFSTEANEVIKKYCEELDCFHLVALETAVSVSKSLSVAVGLLDGAIDISTAVYCARFEEHKQILTNGAVEGHHDIDETYTLMKLTAAKNLVLLKSIK